MIELNVVTIKSDGTLDPESIEVRRRDIVAFVADGTDVVVCFDRADFFGAYRFQIPDGAILPLVVLDRAPEGLTAYTIKTDLEAECFPRSDHQGSILISGAAAGQRSQEASDDDDDDTGDDQNGSSGGSGDPPREETEPGGGE